jgi:hypothetical protein
MLGNSIEDGDFMTTGQTMLTLGAFMFLTTILMNFYQVLGGTGDTIQNGQDGILATTIATSYKEIARGLAFDEFSDTCSSAIRNATALTSPLHLRREAGEDSLAAFNDIDDLNGFEVEKQAIGSVVRYHTRFTVYYVDPDNIDHYSSVQTFTKRLDMKTWRVYPPVLDPTQIDTMRTTMVMGYFHFN